MGRRHEPEPHGDDLLSRIGSVLGRDLTKCLCAAVGGTQVVLSECPRRGALVDAIGAEGARKLYEELGPGTIIIPMGTLSGMTRRRQEAASLRSEGLSQTQIARKSGVHVRTVARWWNA